MAEELQEPQEQGQQEDADAYEGGDDIIASARIRFRSSTTTNFGVLIININRTTGGVRNIIAGVSHYPTFYDDVDPAVPWYQVETMIAEKKWRNDIVINFSNDLQTTVEEELKDEFLEDVSKAIAKQDEGMVTHYMFPILSKIIGDKQIEMDAHFSEMSKAELDELLQSGQQQEEGQEEAVAQMSVQPEQASSMFNLEPGSTIVDCGLVLAPISGISIYDVSRGDEIMVRITNDNEKGRQVNARLNLIEENKVLAVPAIVKEKKVNESNEVLLLLHVQDKIYAKVLEAEPVKVKKNQEELSKGFSKNKVGDNGEKGGGQTVILWVLLGLLLIAAVGIVIFFASQG